MRLPGLGRFQLADWIAERITHGAFSRYRDRAARAEAQAAVLAAPPCQLCGCPVAKGFDEQHARWHYWMATALWGAGGGKGPKPPMPPFMRAERRRRNAEQLAAVFPERAGSEPG